MRVPNYKPGKKKLVVNFVLSFFLFLNTHTTFAQTKEQPSQIDFNEFCGRVIEYYPKLKARNADVEVAIAKKMQAAAGFFPRIQATAVYTDSDDPVYVFGTLLKQGSFSQSHFAIDSLNNPRARSNFNFAIKAQIPLFDAFQTILRVKSAKLGLNAAKDMEAFTKQEAILIAQDAFVHALVLEKLYFVINEVVDASQLDIKKAQDLKEKGMVLGADFYTAKVMHGNFLRIRNELTRQKRAMAMLLNILMGADPGKEITLKGELKSLQLAPVQTQALIDDAYKNRLDYASLSTQLQAQEIDTKREKATALPTVSAFGGLEDNRHTIRNDGGNSFMAGIKGEVPLFDPTYPGRIKEARAQTKKIEALKLSLRDSIASDISREHAHFTALNDNIGVSSEMAGDAQEALTLTIPLYNEGRKSIADLLEIRNSYLHAYENYYNTLSSLQMSHTRLLFLSGKLNEAQIAEIIKQIGG